MFSIIRRTNLVVNGLVKPVVEHHQIARTINTTPCVFAARKGIRIARMKALLARGAKQRKAEKQVKKAWVHPKFRFDRNLTGMSKKRYTDIGKKDLPKDNVFFLENFKELSYTIEEAIDLHREVLDKTILNEPDAMMCTKVELNLRLKKKTKCMKSLFGVYLFPNDYFFKRENRVVAICRNDEEIEMCNNSGVLMAGSQDLLKLIKSKELKEVDYDYLICHNDMLLQLTESKKILGERFPGPYLNNFGSDMSKLVNRFVNGITYNMKVDIIEQDYGYVETHFGRANMSNEKLKENLLGFLQEIQKHKPSDTEHPLITRVLITAPPNDEKFKIRHWEYMKLQDPFIFELKRYEQEKKEREEERKRRLKKMKK